MLLGIVFAFEKDTKDPNWRVLHYNFFLYMITLFSYIDFKLFDFLWLTELLLKVLPVFAESF